MMAKLKRTTVVCIHKMKVIMGVAVAAVTLTAVGGVRLGAPFSDGVVLQRGMKVPVWGTATVGATVAVSFAGQEKCATVGADGAWRVDLDPMAASTEERTMTVSERSGTQAVSTKTVARVLVGEVWMASGQSNMECPIWGRGTRYRDCNGGLLVQMTRLPLVRFVSVECKWSAEPVETHARWRKFDAAGLRDGRPLSAVAFYYARELYLALGIPIGIVNVSRGGTNIDAWTPRCGYADCDTSIRTTAEYVVKAPDAWTDADKRGPITNPHQQPTVLWNGMVAAYAPMAVRGFIWYQGCHNEGEHQLYAAKLHALYNGWSRAFENAALKMYLVQLAPYRRNWLGICAAQNRFVAEQKNAAIAVTSDVGNFDDIHPNRKETVAKRLVAHALKRDYGLDIGEDDSPVLRSAEYGNGQAKLTFDHVKDWYVYAPDRSHEPAFELAGTNGVWASAKIVNWKPGKNKKGETVESDFVAGATLVLESDAVAEPVAARYMGRDRTAGTMYNEVALPLGPFETR